MKNRLIFVFVMMYAVTISCTEDVKTPGEITIEQMSRVVENGNIQSASAYRLTPSGSELLHSASDFKFEGNTIVFLPQQGSGNVRHYYNAEKVLSFQAVDGILHIYFS